MSAARKVDRQKASFTTAEVRRAIEAVEKAGKTAAGVDFPPQGGFRVLIGEPATAVVGAGAPNEWDEVLAPK